MRLGVGFKLGIWMALFGILSTSLIGYYAYSKSRELLIAASEDKLLTATQVVGQRFTDSLAPATDDLLLITSTPALRMVMEEAANPVDFAHNKAIIADLFAAMLKSHKDYLQVRLIGVGEHGRELIRADRTVTGIRLVHDDDLQEKGFLPYFFESIKLAPGTIYFSTINLNREQGKPSDRGVPTLRIATPLHTSAGNVFGIVVINLDLNRMFNRIRSNLPQSIDVILTNKSGDYLIHPDDSKTFGFDMGRRVLIQDDIPETLPLMEQTMTRSVVTRVDTNTFNSAHAAAFVRIPFGAAEQQRAVILGLQTPLRSVLHDSKILGFTIIQITLLCSLVAACLAFLLSFVLAKPLNAMAAAVKQFDAGKPIVNLPTERDDEVGTLARSFLQMSNRLSVQMADLKTRERHLNHLAHHDLLTELPNRAMFQQSLEAAITTARMHNASFCLMFVDLDQFKAVNDELGHSVGDQALQLAAMRMRGAVRGNDLISRLGGDEFTILIEGCKQSAEVEIIGHKLIKVFSEPFVVDGHTFDLTCSIGISIYPGDGQNADQMLMHADSAMYAAKQAGRNTFAWYRQPVAQST
ncbi:sensor domain-containing diguanylate cyclase [Actimicrobium antarcticum]|uniref:GGDEF domain-containing protein n=1 Tax=Actimicrobium antarcticum TaxID=1051899 RepID=A0ABP7SH30_9BURK